MNIPAQKKINYVNIAILAFFVLKILVEVLYYFFPNCIIFTNTFFNYTITEVLIIVPFLAVFAILKTNPLKEIKFNKMKPVNYVLVILFGICMQPILTFVNALSLVFTTNTATSSAIAGLYNEFPYIVSLIIMAVIPAFCEETAFRGALCQSYRPASPWKSVLVSALLFGVAHGNLNQFCYAFVMGIIAALLIEATGSIVSTMIIHFLMNATSVTLVYLLPKFYEFLKNCMVIYEEMGLTEYKKALEQVVGDTGATADEWVNSLFASTGTAEISFFGVIMTYLPLAVISFFICALIFRGIAKNAGTWDRFRTAYLYADNVPVEKTSAGPYERQVVTNEKEIKGDRSLTIFTVPLMISLALGVIYIFIYETLSMLPR